MKLGVLLEGLKLKSTLNLLAILQTQNLKGQLFFQQDHKINKFHQYQDIYR